MKISKSNPRSKLRGIKCHSRAGGNLKAKTPAFAGVTRKNEASFEELHLEEIKPHLNGI
jgi:hypothetical protein